MTRRVPTMKQLATLLIFILNVSLSVRLASEVVQQHLPSSDESEIKSFFCKLRESCNAKDVEEVKRLAGESWRTWVESVNGEERIDSIEVVSISYVNTTNVITRITVLKKSGVSQTEEVWFKLSKTDAGYIVEQMEIPRVAKREIEMKNALDKLRILINAINGHDIALIKSIVSFDDAPQFDNELSARGLWWIKDVIAADVKVPTSGCSVRRKETDDIVGIIQVPCRSEGTSNCTYRVLFEGDKIDRAEPAVDPVSEAMKKFYEWKKASRESRRK